MSSGILVSTELPAYGMLPLNVEILPGNHAIRSGKEKRSQYLQRLRSIAVRIKKHSCGERYVGIFLADTSALGRRFPRPDGAPKKDRPPDPWDRAAVRGSSDRGRKRDRRTLRHLH